MTRAQLAADLRVRTHDAALVEPDLFNTFLRAAEPELFRRTEEPGRTVRIAVQDPGRIVGLPIDLIDFRALYGPVMICDDGTLQGKFNKVPQVESSAPDEDNLTHGYTIEGRNLILPDDQRYDLVYLAKPASLVEYESNRLLTNAYSLYLYAMLVEAYMYLGDPDATAENSAHLDRLIGSYLSARNALDTPRDLNFIGPRSRKRI